MCQLGCFNNKNERCRDLRPVLAQMTKREYGAGARIRLTFQRPNIVGDWGGSVSAYHDGFAKAYAPLSWGA